MIMKMFVRIILAFFIFNIYSSDVCAKNVILIGIDCLRKSHVSCYGYLQNTTPNLDKFAKESIVFTNAYSPSSWTLPAFMSWFTCCYPSEHKIVNELYKDKRGRFLTSSLDI